MRRMIWLIAAATMGFASPGFAMGGAGGGSMGGYGGGMPMMSGSTDEYVMALRLIHHEKYADAIPHLNRALQQKPNSADILNYLGYTHRMVGDYQVSLDFYQQALARNPDHKGAHEYLGELYLKMHQLSQAQTQLAELTRLCPDGCDEKDVLTKAISDYQLAATAPAAPAASASAVPPASASEVPPATPASSAPAEQPAAQAPAPAQQ